MNRNKNSLGIVGLVMVGVLGACEAGYKEYNLEGLWRVDSAYTYYNGFANMDLDPSNWATYEYAADGSLKEIKEGSFLPYTYQLSGDTLIHFTSQGERFQEYEILHLSATKMVLKKDKAPIFGGGNQERYEIRYFTKN